VCVLDADPAVRDSLETLIALNGMAVQGYASGREFLKACETLKPLCILCEAELPDMSGIELKVLLGLRNIHVPFALLVSGNRVRVFRLAADAGIKDIYRKPLVNTPELIKFVCSQ